LSRNNKWYFSNSSIFVTLIGLKKRVILYNWNILEDFLKPDIDYREYIMKKRWFKYSWIGYLYSWIILNCRANRMMELWADILPISTPDYFSNVPFLRCWISLNSHLWQPVHKNWDSYKFNFSRREHCRDNQAYF